MAPDPRSGAYPAPCALWSAVKVRSTDPRAKRAGLTEGAQRCAHRSPQGCSAVSRRRRPLDQRQTAAGGRSPTTAPRHESTSTPTLQIHFTRQSLTLLSAAHPRGPSSRMVSNDFDERLGYPLTGSAVSVIRLPGGGSSSPQGAVLPLTQVPPGAHRGRSLTGGLERLALG